MVLGDPRTLVLGTVAFTTFWVLAVFPSFKLLPIGRTAGAVAGAVLTVVFQVLSPHDAYAAINLSILGLLFGTMVVGMYLDRADMFKYLAQALSWRSQGGKDLLCRLCILSAISSALFTNDTSCVVLTEFVLKLCRQKNLRPKPFLIALATSANIGSVATPIGNPQNLVIAVQSGISFGKFLMGLLPCMFLGVFVNTFLLLVVYWRQLSPIEETSIRAEGLEDAKFKFGSPELADVVVELSGRSNPTPEVGSCCPQLERVATCPMARCSSQQESATTCGVPFCNTQPGNASISPPKETDENAENSSASDFSRISVIADKVACPAAFELQPSSWTATGAIDVSDILSGQMHSTSRSTSHSKEEEKCFHEIYGDENVCAIQACKRRAWKCAVYMVTVGMLAALLYGLDLSWSALTAAVAMMALDFQDAGPNLDKVSYSLLVFFAGMFITVDGFNRTGIPGTFWDLVEPHARIDSGSGTVILALVVIILSNVASNVPTVLLLGSRVSASAAAHGATVIRAWLILAWTSTVAGNLTLVGSAANLIVSEQARKAQLLGYELTFWSHLLFGFPSTLVVASVGLFAIRG